MAQHVKLTAFPPIANRNAKLLILGSMPGVKSLQQQQYYAHPRNAFWPILGHCLNQAAESYTQRTALALNNGIAIWDVLLHCERPGSLDSRIRKESVVCNDFKDFFKQHQNIQTIAFNGKTAEKLYRMHVDKEQGESLYTSLKSLPEKHALPSTSPAMASLNFAAKLKIWRETLFDC